MAHQRQLIREKVKSLLLGNTAAETRVFESRVIPWNKLQLPAIAVYLGNEDIDPPSSTSAPRELKRTVDVRIEAAVQQTDNPDDAMDDLLLEIESVLSPEETWGGVVSDSFLAGVPEPEILETGGKLVGVLTVIYSATYYDYALQEEPSLAVFDRANIRHKLNNTVHVNNEARDTLDDINQE